MQISYTFRLKFHLLYYNNYMPNYSVKNASFDAVKFYKFQKQMFYETR